MEDLTPEARLKKLEKLIRQKQAEKEKLEAQEEENEEELQKVKAEIQAELEHLREDDEVRRLMARIEQLEAQGQTDTNIASELDRRGVRKGVAELAMQLHLIEHPGHEEEVRGRFEREHLDELVGPPDNKASEQGPVYKGPDDQLEEQAALYKGGPEERKEAYRSGPGTEMPDEAYKQQKQEETYRRVEHQDKSRSERQLGQTGLRIGGEYVGYDEDY